MEIGVRAEATHAVRARGQWGVCACRGDHASPQSLGPWDWSELCGGCEREVRDSLSALLNIFIHSSAHVPGTGVRQVNMTGPLPPGALRLENRDSRQKYLG